MSFLNHVVEFCSVIASSLGGKNGAVLYDVEGIAGFEGEDAEQSSAEPAYSALGILAAPLPPEGEFRLEALGLRTEDGLTPFAYRDLRINRAVNGGGAPTAPRPGQTLFAGYGGAFIGHSMTAQPTGSKKGNVTTIYVPYAFSGDTPGKAHAIIIDPSEGNSSISLVHGDGVFFTLSEDTGSGPGIVASVGSSTFFRMAAGELTLQADRVMLKGNVYLGRNAEAGVQLLGGPVSPASASVFVSTL